MSKPKWSSSDENGYMFAGVVDIDEPDVNNYHELVTYMDTLVAEATSNPDMVIGKLTSFIYNLAKNYFDHIEYLEEEVKNLRRQYERHSHVGAVVVKD